MSCTLPNHQAEKKSSARPYSLLARNPIDIAPVLEQHAPDAHHARLAVAVVRVLIGRLRVGGELRRAAAVRGRERLVPRREDVLRRVGRGVLGCHTSQSARFNSGRRGTHSGDFVQLSLDAEAECVQV